MLDILYDSGPCLVVNKPAGLLTQAPAGIDSLEVHVKAFYREREQKEGRGEASHGLVSSSCCNSASRSARAALRNPTWRPTMSPFGPMTYDDGMPGTW